MKKLIYFLEFIFIKILFILFQIIGYKLSSNLGFFIVKTIGPIFRSNKLKKYISIEGLEHLENIKKKKQKSCIYFRSF